MGYRTNIYFCISGSVLFFALALILPAIRKRVLDQGVKYAIVWQPDSPKITDDRYRSNAGPGALPVYSSFYLFNITNMEGIRRGEKPELDEIGPFVYRKVVTKLDVVWSDDDTLSAKDFVYYTFEPNLTVIPLNVNITTLNLGLIGVLESAHEKVSSAMYTRLVDFVVALVASWRNDHFNGLFQTRTAEELIFGYEDVLLQRLTRLLPKGTIPTTRVELVHNMTSEEEARDTPPVIYNTGQSNLSNVWQVESIDGLTKMSCWNNCTEEIVGTDGTQHHPGITRDQKLKVWARPLYRTETFDYAEDVSLFGVRLLRFEQSKADFEPDPCHYQEIRGLMNLTIPKAVGEHGSRGDALGPPVYISRPHFCDADPSLAQGVVGIRCDPEIHTFYLDVEPITGIAMRAHLRVMLSSEMTEGARKHLEPKLDRATAGRTIIPIFWMDEYGHAPQKTAKQFRDNVYRLLKAVEVFWYSCLFGGIVLLLLTLALAHHHRALIRERAMDDQNNDPRSAYSWAHSNNGQRLLEEAREPLLVPVSTQGSPGESD